MLRMLIMSAQDALRSAPDVIDRARSALGSLHLGDNDAFFATHIAPHLTEWARQVTMGDDDTFADALTLYANSGGINGPCGPVTDAHVEWSPAPETRNWILTLHATLASRAGGPVHRAASWEIPWDELPDVVRAAVIRKSVKRGRFDIVTPSKEV